MKIAYIRTRKPSAKKATPEKDWMELRWAQRAADKHAKTLEEHGVSKEDFIQRVLNNQK